jgi:GNAT superfamily N-acetyltransferase
MTQPTANALFAAMEATWPPATERLLGDWRMFDGQGGGKRVSAARAVSMAQSPDIAQAEASMLAAAQPPLFMLRADEVALASQFEARGYRVADPTVLYAVPTAILARTPPPVSLFSIWPPLAIMQDIWAEGGIGGARLAVMDRVAAPKTAFIARTENRAAGTAFVAIHNGIAMLHALEVLPNMRRKGVARNMVHGAADWALSRGAEWVSLAVTEGNLGARALYRALGMVEVTKYHYRQVP